MDFVPRWAIFLEVLPAQSCVMESTGIFSIVSVFTKVLGTTRRRMCDEISISLSDSMLDDLGVCGGYPTITVIGMDSCTRLSGCSI